MSVTTTPDPKDLKWGDYTGPAPGRSPLDAFTKPRFTLGNTKAVKDGEAYRLEKVDIALTLEKFHCWVKSGKKTDDLLEHERGHWKMQSVVAKEMEAAMAALRGRRSRRALQVGGRHVRLVPHQAVRLRRQAVRRRHEPRDRRRRSRASGTARSRAGSRRARSTSPARPEADGHAPDAAPLSLRPIAEERPAREEDRRPREREARLGDGHPRRDGERARGCRARGRAG